MFNEGRVNFFERSLLMLRKSLLAVIAATSITLGMGAAAPVEAKVFISLGFGSPYYYGDPYPYYAYPSYGYPVYGYRHYHHHYYHGCGLRRGYVRVWNHHRHRYVKVRTTRRVCY
jgi:hypothetical protein